MTETALQSGHVRFHDSLAHLLTDASEVTPHPANPRNGDVDVIAESMQRNGCYRPVVAQRGTGYILAGNHAYMAMLSLGATQVPVVFVDVDDATATRILLVDNRSADIGNYDDGLLLDLLRDVDANDSFVGTGYSAAEFAQLTTVIEVNDLPDPDAGVDDPNAWPLLRIRIPPKARDAFWDLTAGLPDDTSRFLALLRKAGWDQ